MYAYKFYLPSLDRRDFGVLDFASFGSVGPIISLHFSTALFADKTKNVDSPLKIRMTFNQSVIVNWRILLKDLNYRDNNDTSGGVGLTLRGFLFEILEP